MNASSLEFLKSLVNTPSPSGYESRGQEIWLDYVASFAQEVSADHYGNAVAVLNKGGSPRIMLAAHADEISMVVNYIDEHGYLFVRKVGGVDAAITKAQRVTVHSEKGAVLGVVGNVAPHLQKESEDRRPKIHEIFIDIGVGSRRKAETLVRVGNPVTVNAQFEVLRGDRVVARAFDNRVGTFAVAEALRLLAGPGAGLEAEVCGVSNVMEEIGLYGARQVAFTLNPDVALITDVTHATDYPEVDRRQHGNIQLGQGPALTHGCANHPEVVALLEHTAAKEKIKIQHETVSSSTGTDTDAVFWTRGGIPSALISLPNRYMHSPVEVVSLSDLEKIPRLMAAFSLGLKKGQGFRVPLASRQKPVQDLNEDGRGRG